MTTIVLYIDYLTQLLDKNFTLNIMAIHILFVSLLIVEHSLDSGQWTVDPGPLGSE